MKQVSVVAAKMKTSSILCIYSVRVFLALETSSLFNRILCAIYRTQHFPVWPITFNNNRIWEFDYAIQFITFLIDSRSSAGAMQSSHHYAFAYLLFNDFYYFSRFFSGDGIQHWLWLEACLFASSLTQFRLSVSQSHTHTAHSQITHVRTPSNAMTYTQHYHYQFDIYRTKSYRFSHTNRNWRNT